MIDTLQRKFEVKTAVRTRVPLMIGLSGPSGAGKTYSALRLATGMREIAGGEIVVIDTENQRARTTPISFAFGTSISRRPSARRITSTRLPPPRGGLRA